MKASGFQTDLLQFHSFLREGSIKNPSELVKQKLYLKKTPVYCIISSLVKMAEGIELFIFCFVKFNVQNIQAIASLET